MEIILVVSFKGTPGFISGWPRKQPEGANSPHLDFPQGAPRHLHGRPEALFLVLFHLPKVHAAHSASRANVTLCCGSVKRPANRKPKLPTQGVTRKPGTQGHEQRPAASTAASGTSCGPSPVAREVALWGHAWLPQLAAHQSTQRQYAKAEHATLRWECCAPPPTPCPSPLLLEELNKARAVCAGTSTPSTSGRQKRKTRATAATANKYFAATFKTLISH